MRSEEQKCRVESQVELKYCERCGGLWLRAVRSETVYCRGCGVEVAKLPPVARDIESAEERTERWEVWEKVKDNDDESEHFTTAGGAA